MDPLEEETPGISPYHYCYDNPVNYIDPFGLQCSDPNDDRDIYGRKKHDINGLYISPMDRPGGMFATGYGDPGCGHWETTMTEHGSYATVANDPLSSNGISIVSVACITYSRTFVWDTSSRHRNPKSGEAGYGGAKVFVEMDNLGHAYIELKGTVFSYGRYNGSYSPASGRFGPVGPGIMMRYKGHEAQNFIKKRTAKYPTNVYNINNAHFNADAAYNYLNNLYWSGSPTSSGGRDVGTYLLIGSSCATTVCEGLNAGGYPINAETPAQLNNLLNLLLSLQKYQINKQMKLLKILSIIVFILILLDSFAYVNILISEKYEIDLLETNIEVEGKGLPNESIEIRKKEILTQKKRTKIELIVLSSMLIGMISIKIYDSCKSKPKINI